MPLIDKQAAADNGGGTRNDYGGGQGRRNNMINGVNITDRSFSRKEWDTLGPEGRTTVLSTMRDRTQDRGCRNGGGGRDGGGRGRVSFQGGENEHTIMAIVEYKADVPPATEDDNTLTDRGGRNGRSFGRGAYGQKGSPPSLFGDVEKSYHMLRHGLAFQSFRCDTSDKRAVHRTFNIGQLRALWPTINWILTQTCLALEQIGA
jgi:hypothetical protein